VISTTTRRSLPAAVLWDMDGTLVDTEPYWFDAERELVEAFGGTWPEHHAKAVVGFDLLDSAEYIKRHGGVPLDPHEIVDRLLDGVIHRLRRNIPWRPGARRLLRDLNEAGVPCALVTMSWRRFVDPIVDALPSGTFVDVIVGDEVPLGEGKPHPTPYVMAANSCGADPRDCLAIEDSPTGVRSALAAGCQVLGVPNVRALKPARNVTVIESLREMGLDDLAGLMTESKHDRSRTGSFDIRRRRAVIGGLAAIALVLAVVAFVKSRGGDDPPPLPPGAIPLDVWAPYWTLTDTLLEADARLSDIREVSPFWFGSRSATSIVVDENAPVDETDAFLGRIKGSRARLVPSIRDEMPAGGMAGVLADPASRDLHIDTIAEFADQLDADGIDLDYEVFAYQDGSDTWEATRPNWVTFVTDLAARLHDDGRTLTVTIPPVFDAETTGERGYWVYDPGAIAEHVDAVRIMGYDYSVAEQGPIAPLDWVGNVVAGATKAVPEEYRSKLVLGVPSYGYNWITSTSGTCPANAEGTTPATARSVLDLATRRGGVPAFDPVLGEWSFTYDLTVDDGTTSCVQSRIVRWVDAEGAAARAEIARRAGWGGAALWAVGYDDDAVWAALMSATRAPISAVATTLAPVDSTGAGA
jgi:HAD superfamily hydrolase (TIGR01509 family)